MGGGAKLESFKIDLMGPFVARGRGVDLSNLSRGELEMPSWGTSWKIGGKGEKPTFLVALEPVGTSIDDVTGEDTGGVSVEVWRFDECDAFSSASSWPFSRKSRAFWMCSWTSFGGVGGRAGSDVNSEADDDSIVSRKRPNQTLRCCSHVQKAKEWEMS